LYKAATENQPNDFASRNSSVLLARSDIKTTTAAREYRPFSGPPDQGHRVLRAGLGAGWRDREFFSEANFRLAFHDLLDPEYGYTPDAQIEALGVALRRYHPQRTYADRTVYFDQYRLPVAGQRAFSKSILEDQHRTRNHST